MERTDRLQRVMAARGVGSRRAAEELIRAGRVTVDGEVVTDLGTKVDPVAAVIRVDGRLLKAQRPRTILLNKPSGYITTTSDERGRRTVMDLVRVPERVYPVGRLDRDTQGLLILTNDGDVANRVMHPRYELDKEYHVLTLSRPSDRTLQRIRDGVNVEGRKVVPEEFRILRETREGVILKIVIHQGMYHVVRLMMETVGIPVHRLRRVRIGPLSVSGIPVGTWRDVTPGELHQLYQALHLDQPEDATVPERPARGNRRPRRAAARSPSRKPAGGERRSAPGRGSGNGNRSEPHHLAGQRSDNSSTQRSDKPSTERRRGTSPSGPPRPTEGRGDDQGNASNDEQRFEQRRNWRRSRNDERPSRHGPSPRGGDRRGGGGGQDDRRPPPRRSPGRDAL
jgi:pseudouridine synthase